MHALSYLPSSIGRLAYPGYEGAGLGIFLPVKQPPGGGELDIDTRTRNATLRSSGCRGEPGFALPAGRLRTASGATCHETLSLRMKGRRIPARPQDGRLPCKRQTQYRAGWSAGEPFRAQGRRIARCGC